MLNVKKNYSSYLFTIMVFFFTLSACDTNNLFNQNEDVPELWNKNHKINFSVDVKDTISPFNFYINMRNTTDYQYSNIYLFLETKFPNGMYAIDTVELFVADVNGKWLGKGLGKNKDNQILFRQRGRFPMKGTYVFSFEQAMKNEDLQGINSIGISIEKTE